MKKIKSNSHKTDKKSQSSFEYVLILTGIVLFSILITLILKSVFNDNLSSSINLQLGAWEGAVSVTNYFAQINQTTTTTLASTTTTTTTTSTTLSSTTSTTTTTTTSSTTSTTLQSIWYTEGEGAPGQYEVIGNFVNGTIQTSQSVCGQYPVGLAIDNNGNGWSSESSCTQTGSFIGDYQVLSNGTVYKFAYNGTVGTLGIDSNGNIWTVTGDNVSEMYVNGTQIGVYALPDAPTQIVFDSNNNLYTANENNQSISKLTNNGVSVANYTLPFTPYGIAVNSSEYIWAINKANNTVSELDNNGNIIFNYTVPTNPIGIAVDSSNNLWVGSTGVISEYNDAGKQLNNYTISGVSGVVLDSTGRVWTRSTYTIYEIFPNSTIVAPINRTIYPIEQFNTN